MNGELDLGFVEVALKVLVLYGGSGLVAWALVDKGKVKMKEVGWTDFTVRTIALVLSAGIALVAWWVATELGFFAKPDSTWQSWFIHIGAVAGPATGASQFIHGLINKRK
jgi:hypothetical protein